MAFFPIAEDVTIIETRDIISTTRFNTQAESTTVNSSSNPIFPVIGAILGSVAIIVIVILVGILAALSSVIYTQNKSRMVCASNRDAGVQRCIYL